MLRIFSKLSVAVLLALLVQIFCAGFFIFDILSSLFGFWTVPFDWQTREYLEIGAALGLLLGVIMGIVTLYHALWRQTRAEEQLRRASVAFMDMLEEQFAEWALTPAERDVALFAIKGLSTAEIAALRCTSEGTVKAQTNAIYRKAGVSGRPQLLSLFIDELMQDAPIAQRVAAPLQAVQSAA
jgi:DNA-binding CsgD family transcriptional regulator